MTYRRDGQAALVIGGTGALGAAITRELAAQGAHVAFTWRSNADAATALAAHIEAKGRRCLHGAVAIEDADAVDAFVAEAALAFGRLDTLVYASAPPFPLDFISRIAIADWSRVVDVEVKGAFHVVRACMPHLRAAKGSIVALITGAVDGALPRDILSVVPKAAIQALIRGVAVEEGREGVRANCLAPGHVAGGVGQKIMETLTADQAAAVVRGTPLRRLGEVREIVDAAAFLSSDQASFVTGATLFVTGGMDL